jgi:thiol-disulfide isomerase/thioredoxin
MARLAPGVEPGAMIPVMKLMYFYAPWCAVCREKGPVAGQIAEAADLDLERWNVEEEAGRAEGEQRRIKGIPTLALVDGDRIPFRLIGRMITPDNARHLLQKFGIG